MMPTILIIDDEEENRSLACMILSRHGYSVIEEEDAKAGIDTARRQRPDLILMDISMPLLDGWTATRVLKSDPGLVGIPIIAWTALNIGGEPGALAAGYDGYLPKPVDLARFMSQIEALLPDKPRRPEARPAAHPEEVSFLTSDVIPPEALADARLLLVAHDEAVRQEFRRQLTAQGYSRFVEAVDVPGAAKLAGAQRVDLVLLDVPGHHFDALQQLRSDRRLERLPVIVVVGEQAAPSDAARSLGLGADDYVLRPIQWGELALRVLNRLRVKLLEDKVQRRQLDLEVLYQASQLLSASLDPATVLALVLEQAAASVETPQGRLDLLGADCQIVRELCTSNLAETPLATLQALFQGQRAEWVCSLLEPLAINNTPGNPHWLRLAQDSHTHATLIVPLVGREGVLGLLVLDHDEAGHFTPEHIAWLKALVAQAAVALDNARLFENVRNERKKLSAIVDSSPDPIVVVDDELRIALINKAAEPALGLGVSTIGHSIRQALPHSPLLALFDFAELRNEPTSLEIAVGDGVYDATVRPVPGLGYVAVLHDIRLLKQVEEIQLERERQETERVRREFARHVSPQVVEQLLKRGESLDLLRKCKAAILFSDLRNYTALTERIGVESMVEYVLKRYLTVMTDIIYAQVGTINKVLGDGIMAVFGVPFAQDDAPQRALRTAMAMQRAMAMLRQGWLRDVGQDISMGIGLAWGEVIAGNIGGVSQRIDYTVIGDPVNLASRLGELSVAGEVLLTEELADIVGSDGPGWRLEKLKPVLLKGKEQPQRICRAVPV